MKNIVIDCNVFISAFVGGETCSRVLDRAFFNYKICYSEETLKELLTTLKKSKFKKTLKKEIVETMLQLLDTSGVLFTPKHCKVELPDTKDIIYLDLALTAKAKYIITGNHKHFPQKLCKNVEILSPRDFF